MVFGNSFPHFETFLSFARLQEEPFSKSGAKYPLNHKLLGGNSEKKSKSLDLLAKARN